ncbi:MAG: IS21 family transposase, partial [Clostridia bacterium]|nr:IS21 family transposase [Clostridia bacterium]
MMDIFELKAQGYSIRKIAAMTGHSRNTIKKYLYAEEIPKRKPAPPRPSKLDPYKALIRHLVVEKGIDNCEVLLRKLREQGYTGGKSILKDYVRSLRPPKEAPAVMRYETPPGELAQVDFGVLKYQDAAEAVKHVYCFVMTLCYSRDMYVEFVPRADLETFIQCHIRALEHFGGVPRRCLYDNAKIVRVGTDGAGRPIWHPVLLDLAKVLGFLPAVCRPYRAQTKGKVESGIKYVKRNFWPGREFVDLDDLNRQALAWCWEVGQRRHGTTGRRPCDLRREEKLLPLPEPSRLAVFLVSRRRVQRDGFVAYEGVRYGVPANLAGREVEIRIVGAYLEFSYHGQVVASHHRVMGPATVPLPGQWANLPTSAPRRPKTPMAY